MKQELELFAAAGSSWGAPIRTVADARAARRAVVVAVGVAVTAVAAVVAVAAVAAVALAAGPAGAAPTGSLTAQAARACPADRALTAYVADMNDDARLPVALTATVQRLIDRLPAGRDARWVEASRQVGVLAQAISHYVEDGGVSAPPRRIRTAHTTLTAALIALFQVAAPLSGALEVGDGAVVAKALGRFGAVAQAAARWRAAVTAAATFGRVSLPAWMLAAGAQPPVACPAGAAGSS